MGTGASILYITYDGLTDPLGRSQVLPYLLGLSRLGHRITILSCEKPSRFASEGELVRSICAEMGIAWRPIKYHKRPPIFSSAYDTMMLRRKAEKLHRQEHFDIVHCRSYIPAIAGIYLKRKFGVRFLFDMRGFWPEEKVDGGDWPQSNRIFRAVYHYFKRREADFLAAGDHIISLTHDGKRELTTRPQLKPDGAAITVIPCCVDFNHFSVSQEQRIAQRQNLGLPADASVLIYLGSLGGNYMLEEMMDFFRIYRSMRPMARFLFVTRDAAEPIRAAGAARGIDASEIIVRAASREEVPSLVAAGDLGVSFKRPVFSSKACSPTKMGEMLALGLPIVTNCGVGDIAEIVADTGCGVAIERFDKAAYAHALDSIAAMEKAPKRQRERALPWFDVEIGVARYDEIYRSLAGL